MCPPIRIERNPCTSRFGPSAAHLLARDVSRVPISTHTLGVHGLDQVTPERVCSAQRKDRSAGSLAFVFFCDIGIYSMTVRMSGLGLGSSFPFLKVSMTPQRWKDLVKEQYD